MSANSQQVSRNRVSNDWNYGEEQLMYQRQLPGNESRKHLISELQHLFDQQMEKHHQQWLEMYTKTTNEFRDHVSKLYEHISKTAELQESSLKHDIRQEFDELGQNLRRNMKDHFGRCEHAQTSSGESLATSSYSSHEMENTHRNNLGFGNTSQTMEYRNGISMLDVQQDKQMKGKNNLSDSAYDWKMEKHDTTALIVDGLKKNYGHRDKSGQENHSVPSVSYERNNKQSVLDVRASPLYPTNSKNDIGAQFGSSSSPAIPLASKKDDSVQATGFYSEVISNQMKQISSQDIPKSTVSDTSISFSKSFNFEHHQEFTISNIKMLRDSLKPFPCPIIATESWKARFCLKFNSALQLQIRVYISRGEYDSDEEWKFKFTGCGLLFHRCSKRFTQVWQIAQDISQKPSSTKELEFPAEVCLTTSRGRHPNITFKELEFRGFTDNDELSFRWSVNAVRKR